MDNSFSGAVAEPRQYYETNIARYSSLIVALRRRGRLFVAGEIASFAVAVAFVALYTATAWGGWCLAAAAVSLAAYVAVRRADESNDTRAERLEVLREVCARERQWLDGQFGAFDDGLRYADPRHPYTFDIDVFGPNGLYNRICRTVTTGGSDRLARLLSDPLSDPLGSTGLRPADSSTAGGCKTMAESVNARADAVAELALMPDWRKEFCAEGVAPGSWTDRKDGGRIDTAEVARALHGVASVKVGRWALSPVAPALGLAALGGFFATIVLAATTSVPSGVAVTCGIALLAAVLGLCHGTLMEASRAAGRLHGQIGRYVRVVEHIASLSPATPLLRELHEGVAGAAGSFAEAGQIVKALDRRGNILGLILFDMFLLSDFFLLRRFARWQQTFAGHMDGWTEAVSRTDALVSMAAYAYNTPRGARAAIVDGGGEGDGEEQGHGEGQGVVFEAQALRHPFLGDKAVGNDFSICDRHYYIVTGANMAGKSTFLRSVGANWLLAVCGMPVAADSLRLSPFTLFTSMRTTDDLSHGISYFNAELLRLEQLIAYCRDHPHTLIILDEILKGTNSADKLGGSRMFLEWISRRDVTGIIATHDLELSRIADERPDRFANWCFEIGLGSTVTYSYRITPGVARNQNATFLLRRLLKEE